MIKNIHFLHLPCNTLESYKEYIPGCQCKFCQTKIKELYHKLKEEVKYKKLQQYLNQGYSKV